MLSKKIIRLAVLALVMVSSISSSSGLSNMVLCLGEDGHFELEISFQGKCGTTEPISEASRFHDEATESHCGTCTDVTFSIPTGDEFRPSVSWDLSQSVSMALHPAITDLILPALVSVASLPRPPPLASQHLVHLSTIRLLV